MSTPALSPVLQAFFGGQKQMSDLIGQAKDIQDSVLRRQQAQQELVQRQQTIDNLANYQKQEGDRQQKQLELNQQIAAMTHQYQYNEASDRMMKSLQASGVAPDQFMAHHLANLGVPGYDVPGTAGTPQDTYSMSDLPVAASPQQVQLPNISVPTGNMATIPVNGYPDQPATVPAWQTPAQLDAAKRAADLTSQVNEYDQTTGKTANSKMAEQLAVANKRADILEMLAKYNQGWREEAIATRRDADNLKLTAGRTPEQVASDGAIDGQMVASGQKSLKDIPDMLSRKAAGAYLTANGMVEPPKGVIQEFDSTGSSLARLGTSLPGIRSILQDNTQPGGQTANLAASAAQKIAGAFGGTVSPSTVQLNALKTAITPDLEKAAGLSLARAGSSPQMALRFDGLTPNRTDTPDIANTKIALAADELGLHMSNQVATLPKAQQLKQWNDFVNTNQNAINKLPGSVAAKFYRAKLTGKYEAGGILK